MAPITGSIQMRRPPLSSQGRELEPGESIEVSGVDGHGRIQLNGGDDRLTILGDQKRPAFQSLQVDTGEGLDAVRLGNVNVAEKLSVTIPHGGGSIAVEASTAGAIETFIKLGDIKGEAADRFLDKSSTILMRAVKADDIQIGVEGMRTSITVEDTSASTVDGYIKLGDIKGEATDRKFIDKSSAILMHSVKADDIDLNVEGHLTRITVEDTTAGAIDAFIKLGDIKGELAATGYVDKSSPILMRAVKADDIQIGVEGMRTSITVEDTSASTVDGYIKLGDIKGEATDRKFIDKSSAILMHSVKADDIDLNVEGHLTRITVEDTTAGAIDAFIKLGDIKGELAATGYVDKSSPILMRAVKADDIQIGVEGMRTSITVEDTSASTVDGYIKLGDIKGEATDRKFIDKSSAILMHSVKADDIDLNVEGHLTRITVEDTTAGAIDAFIKLGDIKGELAATGYVDKSSPILMRAVKADDIQIGVEGMRTSITVEDTSASTVDGYIKLGDIKGEATDRKFIDKSSAILMHSVKADDIDLNVEGHLTRITVEDTTAGAIDAFIKLGDIKGELAATGYVDKSSTILMRAVKADDIQIGVEGMRTSITVEDTSASTVDGYIKLGDIKGEATDRKFIDKSSAILMHSVKADDIDLNVEGHLTRITVEDTTAGAIDAFIKLGDIKGELAATGYVDKSSTILMRAVKADDIQIGVEGMRTSITVEDTSASTVDGYIKLGDIKGEATDRKFIDKSSAILMHSVKADDIDLNVEGHLTRITVEDTTAGAIDAFIKLGDIKGELAATGYVDKSSPILMRAVKADDIQIGVEGMRTSITVEDTSASTVDGYIKLGDIKGEATDRKFIDKSSAILMRRVEADAIRIDVEGHRTRISVEDTTAGAISAFIKIDDIKGESDDRKFIDKSSTILMSHVTAKGIEVTESRAFAHGWL